MNPEDALDAGPELFWTDAEAAILALVREREWAEAYAADHPSCRIGQLYLDFLRRELVLTENKL